MNLKHLNNNQLKELEKAIALCLSNGLDVIDPEVDKFRKVAKRSEGEFFLAAILGKGLTKHWRDWIFRCPLDAAAAFLHGVPEEFGKPEGNKT